MGDRSSGELELTHFGLCQDEVDGLFEVLASMGLAYRSGATGESDAAKMTSTEDTCLHPTPATKSPRQ